MPLSLVLDAAGILPTARFVVFHSYDDWVDSIDLLDALHPQTILAYGMNGRDLPIPHGAPVRLRVERQMGYKSMKYLHAHRRDGRVRRRRREGEHPERVGLVHGDLAPTCRDFRHDDRPSRAPLRPWQPGDAPSLVRHADDYEVWRFLRDRFPRP